jgi:hypothetical protein
MAVLPISIGPSGYVPQTPASLNAQLIQSVSSVVPGYTANLPSSLIEDVSSTCTYSLLGSDSALGELINSISPFGANAFILYEQGEMLGIQLGEETNTSVLVVFSGPPGFVIVQGFLVSDGTYQYQVIDGGVIEGSGQSAPLFAVATQSGSWSVPSGTVSQLATSVQAGLNPALTVNNPTAGTPAAAAETLPSYQSRVFQANLAASQGMGRYLKTLVANVPGVQARLVSAIQQSGGGWQIVVGGGDPYAVAYAIYSSLFDISTLVGAVLTISGITQADPGVVTTAINHNYSDGQTVTITGSNPADYDGSYTIQVLSPTTFSLGINTTFLPAYVGGAKASPVLRNLSVSLNDYPDSYLVNFVNPPQQVVAITATWNTTSPNFVNPSAIAQLAGPAIVSYINSIPVGQPINLLQLDTAFQAAIANVLSPALLTSLSFAVSINGVGATPVDGTQIILSDPTSYFFTSTAQVVVSQG